MALVIEDGTGKTNATSLADPADIGTALAARGLSTAWDAASSTEQEVAAARASDYVNTNPRYRWRGARKTYDQAFFCPRTGWSERDGGEIPDNVVPPRVILAVALLAPRFLTGTLQSELPDLDRGGKLTSESIAGVYSASYADDAPIGAVIQYIDGLLAPLLRTVGDEPLEMQGFEYTRVGLPDTFQSDAFSPYSDSQGDLSGDGTGEGV